MAEPDLTHRLFPPDATLAAAIAAHVPATLFVLAGAIGVVVLLAGSWIQWRGVALPAAGPGHNALYHVVEMMALPLVYRGARAASARET
jgi:hypothetical protein